LGTGEDLTPYFDTVDLRGQRLCEDMSATIARAMTGSHEAVFDASMFVVRV